MLSGKVFDLKTSVLNQPVDELPGSAAVPIEHHDVQFEQSRRGNERGIRLSDCFCVQRRVRLPVEDRNQRGGIDDDRGKPFSS